MRESRWLRTAVTIALVFGLWALDVSPERWWAVSLATFAAAVIGAAASGFRVTALGIAGGMAIAITGGYVWSLF